MTGTSYLVSIACLLIAAKVAGWLCQRIGVPPVLGQLVVGVLGGSSLLGWVHPDSLLSSLSGLGVILLMFIAGMETDMKQMRQVGVAALVSASMGVILPFVVGSVFAYALGYSLPVPWHAPHCHERKYICSNAKRPGKAPYQRGDNYSGCGSHR